MPNEQNDAHGRTPSDPFAVLAAEHALQLRLCDCLEHLADSLPDQVDRRLAQAIVAVIERDVADHFAWEEEVLFPALRRRAAALATVVPMLRQLESEHERDQDQAGEIAEALATFATQGALRNADMLGYMLRGFFEGQRRHIMWEESVLIPLARTLLSELDLREMAEASTLPERLSRVRIATQELSRP